MDIGELKYELGRTLTNYMVPTAYMQLETMPITPNGKLDLKNLPVPELYRSGRGGAVTYFLQEQLDTWESMSCMN